MKETDRDKLVQDLKRIKAELMDLRQTKQTSNPRFTELSDRAFNVSLHLLIDELGPVGLSAAANETAFDLGVSPVTAARYLEKHITRHAHFRIDRASGLVACRDCSVGMAEVQDEPPPADELTLRRRRNVQGNGKIRGEVITRLEESK
jgi:hypothetical protein